MKKKKATQVLTLVLAVVLLLGGCAGYFALVHQDAVKIVDRTAEDQLQFSGDDNGSSGGGDIPTQAVLSQSVVMFTAAQSRDINNGILTLKSLSSGVEMEIRNGSALDDMGVGDIFFLEGNETTPFGMTYIGKISAVMAGSSTTTYILETPMIDEVFDVLRFSEEGILSEENLVAVECVPGVTLAGQDPSQAYGGSAVCGPTVLSAAGASLIPVATISEKDDLLFNIEIDLAKLLGLGENEPTKNEEVDVMLSYQEKVYVTDTGKRYHKETCVYLYASKKETTLGTALDEGYTPCQVCNPPVVKDDGRATFKPSLTIEGHFGVKDVSYSATCNWDILSGGGLQDLYFNVSGTISAGVKVDGNLKWSLAGRTTKYKLSKAIQFQGLKERLFPLAAIHYAVGLSPVPVSGVGDTSNVQLRSLTQAVPVSVVGIVYVDGHGTVTAGFSAYFNYEKDFVYNKTVVKGGKWTFDNTFDSQPGKIDTGIEVEVTADVDICVGAGLDLYVFNLKVAQLDLLDAGVEASGEAKLQYTNGVANGEENAFKWDAHVRGYLKLLELQLCLKAKIEIFSWLDAGFDLSGELCLLDHTIFEYGKPSDTEFNSSTMSYTHISAKDEKNFYYKDSTGALVIEKDDVRTPLWTEPFFTICGIDKSYIYVLENNTGGNHNIRRIAKNGKTSKVVAEDVALLLTIDEKNIYYVPGFDGTVIYKLDRGSEKVATFANFSKDVLRMVRQGKNFYVTVGENMMFFGFSGSYYLLDKDGNTLADYGSNPAVGNLEKRTFESYYAAIKGTSSGYLRFSAEAVHWLSKTGASIKIPAVTGWNYFEGGIITMENDSGGYRIVLYRAADGSKVTLGKSTHSYALFTVAQDADGRWYYLDQTSSEIILYTVSPDLGSCRVMQRMPRSDFPVDLSDCSASLIDGKLYFYTIRNNNKECQMLYRYTIH